MNLMRGNVNNHGTYTIDEMRQLAKDRGGECKSKRYEGLLKPLDWRCDKGHEFSRAPVTMVYSESFCPQCAQKRRVQKRKLSIQDAHTIAKERGGKCLSSTYIDNHSKLTWECSCGNHWEAALSSIKTGAWCPVCANNRRRKIRLVHTIEEMRSVAKTRGGACLSEVYPPTNQKLRWRCSKLHEWEATSYKILKGQWCPICARELIKANVTRLSIDVAREFARARNGECVSEIYINSGTKMHWRCDKGHEWDATLGNIKYGHWCPTCSRVRAAENTRTGKRRWTLKAILDFVKSKGGSAEPVDAFQSAGKTRFAFTCEKGHTWKTTAASVIAGSWCPTCGTEASRKARLAANVVDLQALALTHGGTCVTKSEGNSKDSVWWQCTAGHVWISLVAHVLEGNWCPACAHLPFTIIHNGMMVTDRYSILTRDRFAEIKVYLESLGGTPINKIKQVNLRFMNDLTSVVNYLLNHDMRTLVCLAPSPIDSISALLPSDILASFSSSKATSVLERMATHVARQLIEVEGRIIDHVVSHVIMFATSQVIKENELRNLHRLVSGFLHKGKTKIAHVNSWLLFITKDLYDQVITLIESNPGMPEKTLVKHLKRFTTEQLTPLINIARGKPGKGSVVVASVEYLEDLPTIHTRPRIATWRAINCDFVDDLFNTCDAISPLITEVTGKELEPALHSWVASKISEVDDRVLYDWLKDRRSPLVYDVFEASAAEKLAWVLGAMLSESRIFVSGNGTRLSIPDSNPLMFLEFLIPQVRHPSLTGTIKTLSPDLVDYLKSSGAIDKDFKRSPIGLSNKDLFLAGFFDAHLVVSNAPYSLLINAPFENFQPWLDAIPFNAPVSASVSEEITIRDGRHDIQQNIADQSPSSHMTIHLLGRKFTSSKEDFDDAILRQVASNIKYVFERVFPLCIHPRLDLVLEIGLYTDDRYGRSKYSSRYARALRRVLKGMGGIDLNPLKSTVAAPIHKPGTRDVLIYMPPWLKALLRSKNLPANAILEAFINRGEFIPKRDERLEVDKSIEDVEGEAVGKDINHT